MSERYYFAYGSNMNARQMKRRCPGVIYAGRAVLRGHAFRINARGVATVAADPGGRSVHGLLWKITAPHEEALDIYEGVREGMYFKREVEVEREGGGDPVWALTYEATEKTAGPPRKGYLERVVAGAREHGLPEEHLAELASWFGDRR